MEEKSEEESADVEPWAGLSPDARLYNWKNYVGLVSDKEFQKIHLLIWKSKMNLTNISIPKDREEVINLHKALFDRGESANSSWCVEEVSFLVWVGYSFYQKQKNLNIYSLNDKIWDEIHSLFPVPRSIEQLRSRWRSIKIMRYRKFIWREEEDNVLRDLMKKSFLKNKWTQIANHINKRSSSNNHRTPKQCRERWNNHLDPQLKRGTWSTEEDAQLLQLVIEKKKKWALIAKLINGRTENAVKNRYFSLLSTIAKNKNPAKPPESHAHFKEEKDMVLELLSKRQSSREKRELARAGEAVGERPGDKTARNIENRNNNPERALDERQAASKSQFTPSQREDLASLPEFLSRKLPSLQVTQAQMEPGSHLHNSFSNGTSSFAFNPRSIALAPTIPQSCENSLSIFQAAPLITTSSVPTITRAHLAVPSSVISVHPLQLAPRQELSTCLIPVTFNSMNIAGSPVSLGQNISMIPAPFTASIDIRGANSVSSQANFSLYPNIVNPSQIISMNPIAFGSLPNLATSYSLPSQNSGDVYNAQARAIGYQIIPQQGLSYGLVARSIPPVNNFDQLAFPRTNNFF